MMRSILIAAAVTASCTLCAGKATSTKKSHGPGISAHYYVKNMTGKTLRLTAKEPGSIPVDFLVRTIPPRSRVHIYTFGEGTGGHVMPSNAFESFLLYSGSNPRHGRVYSGVRDQDWKPAGRTKKGTYLYVLTVK